MPLYWFIIIFVFVTLFIILFFIIKLANPLRYVLKGQVDIAVEMYQKQANQYSQHTMLCNSINYNIALCYNLKGNFEESIEYLKKINLSKIDKNLLSAYYLIYASDLLLLDRDFELSEEYLVKAIKLKDLPGALIIKSYVEAFKGNFQKAGDLIEEYKRKKQVFVILGFYNMMFTNKVLEDITNDFFIGLTYRKMNELDLAKQYFERVGKHELKLFYIEKAKELSQSI